jgi:ATP-binding cassette subfamily G (WHITE) protein 2 (SNQ2)
MLLVLGQPDSGCTTTLRALANQRSGYTRVDGDVTYGGIDHETFAKYFRGEAVYNQEDDVHHPTLKVGQILSFALDTKTPRRRVTGMSVADFKEDVITTLLKMFNMEHTRNTMAGGVAGIRGVSGGERKRISIAEMMITRSSVACWDNTTRGLDASTALDFAKCLRILTDVYQLPNIVSLYQASENIYKLFDKVMVIHHGKQIYFGPTSKARAYFEGLGYEPKPRQTTPDYLTGCTDEFERDIAEGQDPEKVPQTAEAMAQAYKASSIQQDVLTEISAYKEELAANTEAREHFVAAVAEQKRKHTHHKSVYSIPFYRQVFALQKRQFQLKLQDWFTLSTALTTQIVCAVLVGTLFMNLPLTSDGAFTRGTPHLSRVQN